MLLLASPVLRELLDSLLHGGLDLRDQGDHRAARAGGQAERCVSEDPRHRDDRSRRVAALGAACRGQRHGSGGRRRVVHPELPGQELDDRPLRLGCRRLAGVVADRGDRGRLGVEALRLGADDRALQSSGAALVQRPEAVDQRVVADVVPAVAVDVEAADAEDDRGRLLGRVVVGVDGVVDDGGLHRSVLRRPARRAASAGEVRAPAGSAHDLRLRRELQSLGDGRRGHRDEGGVDRVPGRVDEPVGEAA